MRDESKGKENYAGYCAALQRQMPAWEALPPRMKDAWIAGAARVLAGPPTIAVPAPPAVVVKAAGPVLASHPKPTFPIGITAPSPGVPAKVSK